MIGGEEDFPLLGSSASVADGLENVVPSNGGFSSNSSISVSAAARERAAADKGCHGYAEHKFLSLNLSLITAATEHKLFIRFNDRSSSWFGVSFIVLSLPFKQSSLISFPLLFFYPYHLHFTFIISSIKF